MSEGYIRNCPKCEVEISYKNKKSRDTSEQHQSLCETCKEEQYTHICSDCGSARRLRHKFDPLKTRKCRNCCKPRVLPVGSEFKLTCIKCNQDTEYKSYDSLKSANRRSDEFICIKCKDIDSYYELKCINDECSNVLVYNRLGDYKRYLKERPFCKKCGIKNRNKEKAAIRRKKWADKNPDYQLEYRNDPKNTKRLKLNALNSAHRRRAVIKNTSNDATKEHMSYLLDNTKFCELCNGDLSKLKAHLDHIIPLNVGGHHTNENLRVLCSECNLRRPKNGSDMKKIIMCKGLPGSGKSTWAVQEMKKGRSIYIRVNKDLLREMMDGGEYSKEKEKFVVHIRDCIIELALKSGRIVISDDTNLNPIHEKRLRELAKEHGAEFEVKSFLDVSIEDCIKRDLKRERSVGERVIRDMHKKFIDKTPKNPEYREQYEQLPSVYVSDIDGTTSLMAGKRGPYEQDKVFEDEVNWPVVDSLKSGLKSGLVSKIVFLSGRENKGNCYSLTEKWLVEKAGFKREEFDLILRANGDSRKDSIVKIELAEKHIVYNYFVRGWWDDRDQVVEAVRNVLKLPCWQVYYGDF